MSDKSTSGEGAGCCGLQAWVVAVLLQPKIIIFVSPISTMLLPPLGRQLSVTLVTLTLLP